MVTLFEISTDRVRLRWQGEFEPRGEPSAAVFAAAPAGEQTPAGTLRVIPRRPGVSPTVAPYGYPSYTAGPSFISEGPPLFEERAYHVLLSPTKPAKVELICRDPGIVATSTAGTSGELFTVVNFRGQVGYSHFEVWVDGAPEFDIEVEVFPTKIDYKSDYDAILAEISDFFTGLALEYLRATYRWGQPVRAPQPSDVEWLTILRQVIEQLEQALLRIARQPRRRLVRSEELIRVDKLRRVDGAVRRAVLQGKGRGRHVRIAGRAGVPHVREYIEARTPVESLDTPEHRWLKAQLEDIRSRVARLALEERRRLREPWYGKPQRSERIVAELEEIESRITSLLQLEPLAEARGEPPANFSSLLLQAAPGYREAYVTCLVLRLGLRIEGGPFRLSLRDISALYEYWCYLAIARLLARELGAQIKPKDLLRVTPRGLRVEVEAGKTTSLTLSGRGDAGDRPVTVSLTYHPAYDSPTGRQLPDVGLSISVDGWKQPFELILDAKYRLDTSREYIERHGTPGPPEDAVNVLHRYRDAILVLRDPGEGSAPPALRRPARSVILGIALFPFQDPAGEYQGHTFFKSLEKVGIGALPFLPSRQEYVAGFLRELLSQSGWSLADRVLDHHAAMERARWMAEASQAVLVAALHQGEDELEWIKKNRLYYVPLARLGKRKFSARWIAFSQGASGPGGQAGAVTHEAEVLAVDVKRRGEITTPWPPAHPEDLCVVYTLAEVQERPRPILLEHGMPRYRWASRLSLSRAREGSQLYLETEPEWRLYDELKAKGIEFRLRAGHPEVPDPDDPRGRAVFEVGPWGILYAGAAGFRMVKDGHVVYEPFVDRVIERLGGETEWSNLAVRGTRKRSTGPKSSRW